MGSMKKTSAETCLKCKYSSGSSYDLVCEYYSITGNRRNCKVGKCDKFEPRASDHKKKKAYNFVRGWDVKEHDSYYEGRWFE